MVRAALSRTASISSCRTTTCTARSTMRCATSASTSGLPLVATNDCHYLHRDDARAHEVLLCIQTGKTLADETRWRFDTDELYVKTPEEMAAAFGADSEPVRNTVEIAKRVDFEFEFGKFHFPIYQASMERAGRSHDHGRRRLEQAARRATCARASPSACTNCTRGAATSTKRPTSSGSTASCRSSARWASPATC